MDRPIYQVAKTNRRSLRRDVLEVVASGLTMDSASALAQTLREQHRDDESRFGYSVQTMPLAAQVTHLAAAETMAALRDETPLRRAA
jgi:hypothetical protein